MKSNQDYFSFNRLTDVDRVLSRPVLGRGTVVENHIKSIKNDDDLETAAYPNTVFRPRSPGRMGILLLLFSSLIFFSYRHVIVAFPRGIRRIRFALEIVHTRVIRAHLGTYGSDFPTGLEDADFN